MSTRLEARRRRICGGSVQRDGQPRVALASSLPGPVFMMSRPNPSVEPNDEHLQLRDELRSVLASSIRERSVTHTRAPAVHGFRRWWIAASLALAVFAGCGGGKKTDTYA